MAKVESILAGLFLTASLLTLSGCNENQSTKVEVKPVPVTTLQATPVTQPYWIDVFGQTEGDKAVLIYPQVTGPILYRNYSEGQAIKKGDILFKIDPAPFEASYNSAKAATKQAEVYLEKAVREAKRYTELHKVKAVSNKTYTDALSDLETGKAALSAAQAKEKEALITLEYTDVRSPVDGIAGRALVNPGTLVQANSTKLTDITQQTDLKARFSVSDHELHGYTITPDSPVEIISEKIKDPIKAKINFTAVQVDTQTGTRSLSAAVASDKGQGLLPGQFVTVRLTLGEQHNVFLIPQGAVRQLSDGSYAVYVLRDGLARTQAVEVGKWIGKNWIVTGGLKDGDQVIIDNIQKLKDRTKVQANGKKEKSA